MGGPWVNIINENNTMNSKGFINFVIIILGAQGYFVSVRTSAIPVVIENISPAFGSSGEKVVIRGSGFTHANNDVAFTHPAIDFQGRNTAYLSGIFSQDGNTLQFSLPDNDNVLLGACALSQLKSNETCPDIGILLPKGVAQISVVNSNGQSNSVPFTVSPSAAASVRKIATPAGELSLSHKDGQAHLEGVLQRSTPCVEWVVDIKATTHLPVFSVDFTIFDKNKGVICIQILGEPQEIVAAAQASENTHYRVIFEADVVFSGTL
jgi:hypothetical protein